jgi:type VI secretion system secreted protein VgrG
MRADARQAIAEGFEGESSLPNVEAARTIAVDGHPYVTSDDRLLIVWVEHFLTQATLAYANTGVLGYRNRFRAVEATRQYRPPLRTPVPRIAGFAIAVTDVPKGSEILDTAILDEQGRYTVRFLFDRADDQGRPVSSCRLRMMQPHTGAGYGMHFPLKPGIEVAIGFYEGNPDRPFIAGAVPNALTPTPAMDRNAKIHHLQTVTGVSLKIRDA